MANVVNGVHVLCYSVSSNAQPIYIKDLRNMCSLDKV